MLYFLIALERIACANASSFDRGPNKNTKSNIRAHRALRAKDVARDINHEVNWA
jgi:hypothetical protein